MAKKNDTQKNPISCIFKLCYGETRTSKGAKKPGGKKTQFRLYVLIPFPRWYVITELYCILLTTHNVILRSVVI